MSEQKNIKVPDKFDQIFELYLYIGRGNNQDEDGRMLDLEWCTKHYASMLSQLSKSDMIEYQNLLKRYHK